MDLQSFCVENRRKVHSFPFLRSAVQSTEKMSKSFQFGVPVSGPTMEENCFKNIPNISCNAQFTFQGVTKNQDCHSKKTYFDHFNNKFSHLTFTRVVGGFVGSKSQGGSASREPHQVWDVIMRQLVDTACEATMNNNAQQYFSIGEAVSQTFFGQFNNRKNSTLDFTSFLFARPCDFFASKKSSGNMPSSSDEHCQVSSENITTDAQVQLSKVPCDAQSHNINIEENKDMKKTSMQQFTCKQSYADVARTLVAKPDFVYKLPSIPTSTPKNILVKHQYSRQGNEKCNKKSSRLNGSFYIQPSYNHSSQNQQYKKSTMLHDKCEEHIPSKFARDTSHLRHVRTENSNTCKLRTKENNNIHSIPAKDSKGQEEKKRKYRKLRNPNLREKERKNIDLQVQDDAVFACNMPEHMCQNWRCDHNRMSIVHRDREGFVNQRRDLSVKNYKQQSRFHSPPPRTLLPDSDTVDKPEDHLKTETSDISEVRTMHEEILCNNEKSMICFSSNLSRSGDETSESSISSSPTCIPVVLPLRPRVASECSVDSEDFIVFEEDSHDLVEAGNDHGLDLVSCSDYSSSCESDEDCDEVDFSGDIASKDINTNISKRSHAYAFIPVDDLLNCVNARWHEENAEKPDLLKDRIPSNDINSKISESTSADAFIPVAERLKDVNAKWHKENAVLPKAEKVSEKVHFPCAEKLAKVHQMILWPFAYREARRGPWEQIGRDNDRFQARIRRVECELSHVLDSEHRRRIWEERMCDVGST